jgi:ATP-binding cassette, subfamily A (ABC1), member 3
VNKLRKVYYQNGNSKLVAVRNISFGLEYGECFALLGVNGAGKTTTFKSMTGDVVPTDGKIYIDGLDLSSTYEFSKARKLIGYCPQDNAIFEGMTVKEHLVFYSRIKGVLPHLRNKLIEKVMEEMDLKVFENVRSEELSGGNKRKLSVAMAIIGNPPIVFLDEPSTGMDPRAKRFMWTIISRISTLRKKSTVILTTHSMEEAEALCTKMGIMVSGRFKCYGSSQEIKDKFGTGYEIELKLTWPTEEEAVALAKRYNVNPEEEITIYNLDSYLRTAQMERLIDVDQYVSLYSDISKENSITAASLFEWALLEDAGLLVKTALERNTPNCQILEHYNNFFRFRIEKGDKSLGFFFGFMEKLKSEIKFEEYAVSQTTLEQIFNAFAQEQDIEVLEEGNKKRRSTVRKDEEL